MRIRHVFIERFLGFKKLSIEIDRDIQLVAGPNNAGKSSLLRILELFFSDPTQDEIREQFPANSYYSQLGPRTMSTIRVTFGDMTEAENEAFRSALREDGSLSVEIRATRTGIASYRASNGITGSEARQVYEAVLERIAFVKIPSVRVGGVSDIAEPDSLERLLETLEAILIRTGSSRSTKIQERFAKRIADAEEIVEDVLNRSAQAIKDDLPFQEKEVVFRLPDSRYALRGMLEAAIIETQGDAGVPVSQRGTGFQSALVLGILRFVAKSQAGADLRVIFGVEEPEAFLHPQTQRAMAKILRAIAGDAQVIATTHSSVLVDSFPIASIGRLPLQPTGTTHSWSVPNYEPADIGRLSRYCTAANSELVFASAVIFVEGEGDLTVVEKILGRLCQSPGGHYALGITVIEASGLGRIKHLVRLAEHFGVRSFVLADVDGVLPKDGHRVLFDVLKSRATPPSTGEQREIEALADSRVSSLSAAIRRQAQINARLAPFGAFVLSSDLEGLFLDSFGPDQLLSALGPNGEKAFEAQTVEQLARDPKPYEAVARKIGAKGWNGDLKKTGKLEPHLPPLLLDRWFSANTEASKAMRPLIGWLRAIVEESRHQPV